MQDHWSKVHGDLKSIYEEIAAPKGAKPETGEDKAAASAKKVRQAIYDIRYRSGKKNLPLNKVYQDYMQGSGMTPKERAMVKAKIASSSQKEEYQFEYHMSTLQFDEQTGKYKVRVTDKTTGKSFMRTATREKISQLRNNPNISSVEMTTGEKKADKDYDGDGKIESGTDEYMGSRDKAIKKAIASRKEELEVHEDLMSRTLDKMEEGVRDLDPEKGTKERKARLEKKRGMKVDDHPEYKKEEVDVDEKYQGMYQSPAPTHNRLKSGDEKARMSPGRRAMAKSDELEKSEPGSKRAKAQKKAASQMARNFQSARATKEEVEQVDEADSLAAMQARREKRLARQRKQMGTSSTGQDFGHDYGISSAERKKRQQAEFDKFVGRGKKTTKEEVEVTEKKKDDTYLETDMKKRQANNEKARKELAKGPQMKNPHFESKEVELPFGDMKALIKRAAKRVDSDVDGDVDADDKKSGNEMGEFVPTPDGKKKTTRVKESYSSWRNDIIEVMGDEIDDDTKKKIDVMKGKNKIKINPPMGEEVDLSDSLETISEGSDRKYCRLCMKKESRGECSYGPKMFDAYSVDDATDSERAAAAEIADGGGVSEEMTPQEMQVQRKQLQLNRLKIQNQQKALQGKKKSDVPVTSESVLHEMNEVEVELISESFIDQVVEEFFVEFAIENELTEDEIDTLVAEMTLEINESLILTEETDVLINEKLGMVKKAIKAAGSVAKKAVVGGAGLAARGVGTAVRAARKAGGVAREAGAAAKAGYKRGVEGSGSSSSSSTPTSTPKKSATPAGKKLAKGLGKLAKGTAGMAAKAAKKTAGAAMGAAKVAAKATKKVAGKTARGVSKASGAVASKLGESSEDRLRDRRMERGGVDANVDYKKPPKGVKTGPMTDAEKQKYRKASQSAIDSVKASITAKYGKGAIVDTKKK